MLTKELLVKRKEDLENLAVEVDEADLESLVERLKEKDDNIRYAAFLMLQLLSTKDNRVYQYWDTFGKMLGDVNSYQRSLGLMLIAENVRWDKEDRFGAICDEYLKHCDDEKFITARQCIQGLNKIVAYSLKYSQKIVDVLLIIDLRKRKESQQGLLLLDIIEVLGRMDSEKDAERVAVYLKAEYERGNAKVKMAIKKYLK
jgi:hypothetical protein